MIKSKVKKEKLSKRNWKIKKKCSFFIKIAALLFEICDEWQGDVNIPHKIEIANTFNSPNGLTANC